MARESHNKKIRVISNVTLKTNYDVATENVTSVSGPALGVDNIDCCLPLKILEETTYSKEVGATVIDLNSKCSEAMENDIFDIPLDITNMDVIFEKNINNADILNHSDLQTGYAHLTHDSTLSNDSIEGVFNHEEYQEIIVNDQAEETIEIEVEDHSIQDKEEFNSPDSDKESEVDKTLQNEFGIKRKRKINQREIHKATRIRGELYIGHKNKEKQAKKVKENSCIHGCVNYCKYISENQRKILFENYWA